MKISNNQIKLLKKAGVINYDLRKTLTSAQKGWISRKWREWGKYLSPNSDFTPVKISNQRADSNIDVTAKRLKVKGHKFTTVFIKAEKVTVKRDHLVIESDGYVYRAFDNKKGETGEQKLKRIEKRQKEGEFVGVMLGGYIWNARFINKEHLNAYLVDWVPKDYQGSSKENQEKMKQYLMGQMMLISLKGEKIAKKKAKKKAGRN